MPLPKPGNDEDRQEFLERCMDELEGEFPEQNQRYAVCISQWENPKHQVVFYLERILDILNERQETE
jgi:hypothetical protein